MKADKILYKEKEKYPQDHLYNKVVLGICCV